MNLVQKCLVFLFVLSITACAGLSQKPDYVEDQGVRPVKQAVPGGPPPHVTPPGLAKIRGFAVPSHVDKNPNAFYRRIEPAGPVAFPDFEKPRTSANSLRGKGMPVSQSTTLIQGETDEPNSWTGSTGSWENWDGTGWDDNGLETGYLFIPPDPHAAAGPDHLVSVVNVMIQIHDKYTGTSLYLDSLKDFFTEGLGGDGPDTFTFDPKVLYDQYEDRWVVVTLEQTDSPDSSKLFVAVSDDDNPEGTWYMTVIDSSITIGSTDYWADYPGFAVDDQAIYITANLFSFGTYSNGGVRVWIIDKGAGSGGLYDDGVAVVSAYDPYDGNEGLDVTTQPAHMYGTTPFGSGTFLVGFSGIHYTSGDQLGEEALQVVTVEDPLGTPTFTLQYVDTGDIESNNTSLPDADQLGYRRRDIEVNDRRTLDAVWQNDSLWLTATIYPASGENSGDTTAYWAEIDTSNLSALVLSDQGEVGGEDIDPGMFTFFPSIAVDALGNMVTGFSASDSSIFPSAYFVTRSPGDAPGTTSNSQIVKEGVDYYVRDFGGSRNRWGDYSAAVVDTANGCFWVFNEWAALRDTSTREGGRWGTAFAKTCTCASTPRTITFGQWQSFSLPCNPAPAHQVQDVFPQLGSTNYGVTWIVARYDALISAYDFLLKTEPMLPNIGYWVLALEPDPSPTYPINAQTDGSPHPGDDISLVGVVTIGQYNLLGNPQNGTVDWKDFLVVDGGTYTLDQADPLDTNPDPDILECSKVPVPAEGPCRMSRIMYKWNGSSYDPYDGGTPLMEGSLAPHETFWVRAFKPGIALRSPTVAAAASATASSSLALSAEGSTTVAKPENVQSEKSGHEKKQPEGWYIRLIASSANKEDRGNAFGQLSDSIDGLDSHDLETLAPPLGNSYLDVLFTNPLLGETDWGFASDYRALTKKPTGVWPFVVRASADVDEVTLSWEGEKNLFRKVFLLNEHSGEVYKVKQGGSYTFDMDPDGESHFTIMLE